MGNILPHVHGWTSQNGWKILDDVWTSMNFLDESFNKLKCMDKINSKIIMPYENHMYMDKCYKWMKYLDESSLVEISQNVTTPFVITCDL